MQIAIVTVSDRASRGEYEDLSGPLIETWLARAITSSHKLTKRIILDGSSPFAMS
ncbi:Molybdopterin adenylyltransferase [compost metagenome]|jgi:molybdopterin adenylyltransferase